MLYEQKWSTSSHDVNSANYYFLQLQAVAFNIAIGSRPDYPTFYINGASEPNVFSWGIPPADFKYRYAVLDGLLWGKRGTSCFVDFQLFSRFLGSPGGSRLSNLDLDQVTKADGTFEVFIGAHEEFALDPESRSNMILGRECFLDWESEKAAEVHIEIADDKGIGSVVISEERLGEKLKDALAFVKFVISQFAIMNNDGVISGSKSNEFFLDAFGQNAGGAGNPVAIYPSMIYDITEEDALIIEWDIPASCKYWGIQISDIWHQVTDYIYHQSGLNSHQAFIGGDGKFRAVLSLRDPGISNWLDPVAISHGFVICRFYQLQGSVLPISRKVLFEDLTNELPADTLRVTPEQRKASIARRTELLRTRYGY